MVISTAYLRLLKFKKKMFSNHEYSLNDLEIRDLILNESLFLGDDPIRKHFASFVQPASVDLPIENECYLVKDKILPYGRRIRDLIDSLVIMKVDLTSGAILLKGQTYLARCGTIKMPKHCRGSLSPKSSIGRVDIMVRGIFDGCGLYDSIRGGEEGDLWMEISPRSFNVRVFEKQTFSQMMLFASRIPSHIEENFNYSLLFNHNGKSIKPEMHHNGAIVLHLGLTKDDKEEKEDEEKKEEKEDCLRKRMKENVDDIVGWEAIHTNDVVDLSKPNSHPAEQFFRPIFSSQCKDKLNGHVGIDRITLEKDRFYILATKERISIPTMFSAEMIPFSHHIGELRAHYAGFFDPGFGFGRSGEIKGTVGVLEVRPHETVTIFDGQPICLIEYFKNTSKPSVVYGDAGNSYQSQRGAKLAKYFIQDN